MTGNLPEDNRDFYYEEEEVNLLDYWRVIWKRKIFITLIVVITVLTTTIYSISQIDVYRATAVITPANTERGGGSSSLSILTQQFGGIPGISLPSSASTKEIVNLLKSNMIREKMIEKYDLMPILFYQRWDEEKKEWKKGEKSGFSLNPVGLLKKAVYSIFPKETAVSKKNPPNNDGSPSMWNGIRRLQGIIDITNDVKNDTITISADFHDPETAAKMVDYLLETLTEHLSIETKFAANKRKIYLEDQLRSTADPLIRQKIYGLISQQIETTMMSELKDEFAFKVIDPPRVPDQRIRPRRSRAVMLSFMVSLFAGISLAFFLEYIKRMKSREAGKSG